MQVVVTNLNPSTDGGVILAQRINDLKANLYSSHLGSDDVAYAVRGMLSAKDLGGGVVELRYFDGSSHIAIGTVDETANSFTPEGQPDAVPTAAIAYTAASAAPSGWLLCNGQAVSRSTYSGLYAAIGTTYGSGDGSTTFNVPDLCGRVIAGLDNMGGITAKGRLTATVMAPNGNTLGAVGGSQTHTLITAEMPAHRHFTDARPTAGTGTSSLVRSNDSGGFANPQTQSTGGDGAHNNTQPTMLLNVIIKA